VLPGQVLLRGEQMATDCSTFQKIQSTNADDETARLKAVDGPARPFKQRHDGTCRCPGHASSFDEVQQRFAEIRQKIG